MADINATVQLGKNDPKIRNPMDFSASADMSGGQFMEMISSTLSVSDDNDASAKIAQSYTVTAKNDVKYAYNTSAKADVAAHEKVKAAAIDQSAVKEKIRAKIKELAAKNNAQVEDTKALKALQKVANFLLKANKDGDIALPKAMVEKLQAFVAKGDDLKAADITQFMSDFSDMFKQLVVAVPAPVAKLAVDASATSGDAVPAANDGLKWPEDVLNALKELGVAGASANPDQTLTMMDVLRTVKALVNESEKAALKTLDDKSKEAIAGQDQASVLLGATAAATVQAQATTDQPAQTATDDAIAVQSATIQPDAVNNDDAAKKAVKDLQEKIILAAQANQAAAPAVKNDKPEQAPLADAGKIPATPNKPAPNKSPVFASAIDFSEAEAPITKTPAKADMSLSKISLEAQAPGNNADKSFDDSSRDGNARNNSAAFIQAKANLAASVAAPSVSDVKFAASEAASDAIASPAVSATAMNAMTENLKAAGKTAQVAATAPSLPSAATQQVIAQIQQKADKSSQITVQLTPVELGRVEVRLNIQKNGEVHTIIMVDKPETLALLQKDSAQLERSLQQAGLNADAKNMSFNLRDGNQAQQFNQGRKRFSRSDIGNSTVTEVTMNVAPEGQIITDNRVNYHA